MTTSRRSLFGWLAGAVVAAPAVAEAAVAPAPAEPGPFLGQIRMVHSHYETKIVPTYRTWHDGHGAHTHSISQMVPTTESVAVMRYEQWNGSAWIDIGVAPLAAPQPASHTHT